MDAFVDQNTCIRYGACLDRMPEAFGTDREGDTEVRMRDVKDKNDVERLYDAADACPVFAIELSSS
jgi:ferredoxin